MFRCHRGSCLRAETKNREKGVSFYSFPKDKNLKKRWLANIKRKNKKNPKFYHQHFENSCFRKVLKVSFLEVSIFTLINLLLIPFCGISA